MMRSILLATLILATLIAHDASAQDLYKGIAGRVTSVDGEAIEAAVVILEGSRRYVSMSKANGEFFIDPVEDGSYSLVVQRIGYASVRRELTVAGGSARRSDVVLSILPITSAGVTVTATRSRRSVSDLPVAVEVIPQSEIRLDRPRLLTDLLAQRTGITITHDHGAGVQLQGLDADYTLLLVNGDPVIGRVAGTLDLSRLQLDNVEKVEVIRGPTSSLYGSEALAGVINVLTRIPDSSYGGSINARFGSHNTLDIGSGMHYSAGQWSGLLRLQRSSSQGYDLTPETISPTVAPYITWSLQPRLEYHPGTNTDLSLSSQILKSSQQSQVDIATEQDTMRMEDRTRRSEWMISQSSTHRFAGNMTLAGKLYATRFMTENTISHPGAEYYRSEFDQIYIKGEAQLDAVLSAENVLAGGAGVAHEGVAVDRIDGGSQRAASWFLFAQNEWRPGQSTNLTTGLRFDSHDDYGTRLSPRIALMHRPIEWLALRAGLGSGFKAPTFQQLHLDFTNPTVGYSVFGSSGIEQGIARLQQEGRIREILIDVRGIEALRAESSIAANVGFDLRLTDERVGLSANAFINSVTDLIETAPVAMVQSGQQVFTYFNLNHVITRGIESELRFGLIDSFALVLGYSFLDAYDAGALERVQHGEISKTGTTGRLRPVQQAEYGGLFNRSRHSGTLRFSYSNSHLGLDISLRGRARGRYGYADLNTNGILDDESEFVPGYTLWNLTLSQSLTPTLSLFATLDNALDKIDSRIPSLPGRLLGIGFDWKLE